MSRNTGKTELAILKTIPYAKAAPAHIPEQPEIVV